MGKGLPAKYAKMGFKKGWAAYRKAHNKTKKRKSSKSKTKKRKYRLTKKKRRRRCKAKIPLEVAIAGVAIPITPCKDGMQTPLQYAQRGDWDGLGTSLTLGFLGFGTGRQAGVKFDLFKVLNPFDMSRARYSKMLIYAGFLSKVRKKLVHIPFDRVPLIGKYLS